MINNDAPWNGTAGLDLFGAASQQHVADLQQEAAQRRLVRDYRRLHPEQRIRNRFAVVLRRVADRLAPEPLPRTVRPSWRPVITSSRPSPS